MRNRLVIFIVGIFILTLFNLDVQGRELRVPVRIQLRDNWCWAACSQAIICYYGFNIAQCNIANFAFNRRDCCQRDKCNVTNSLFGIRGSVQDVLNNWGIGGLGYDCPLSWNGVKNEIDAYRPFVIGLRWTNGGGHVVVGRGYFTDNGVNFVQYMDPWPGRGYMFAIYNHLLRSNDRRWRQTLTTN